MSNIINTIKIKHGAEIPSDKTLEPYELGYAKKGGLVIGGPDGETKEIISFQYDEKSGTLTIDK